MSQEVIKIYRELFRYARLLPRAQRDEKIIEARKAFKTNMLESDPQKISQCIKGNTHIFFISFVICFVVK